jgi:hypothetical protein
MANDWQHWQAEIDIEEVRAELGPELQLSCERLLSEWRTAEVSGDVIRLPLQIRAFVDELLVRMATVHPEPMSMVRLSGATDRIMIRAIVQGRWSDTLMAARGWDAPDARAEIGGMLEMLRHFQHVGYPNHLDVLRRASADDEDSGLKLPDITLFFESLLELIRNLRETRQSFLGKRPPWA